MVNFDEKTHTYTDESGRVLISTTQLLTLAGISPDYSGVNSEVLRAKAEYGTQVHKDLEEWIKYKKTGLSNELDYFITYCKANSIEPIFSELMVNNDFLAGTIDCIAYDKINNKMIMVDFKTTSSIHTECVSWQLSIYKYLYEHIKTGNKIDGLQVYHFLPNGSLEVKDIAEKSKERIEDLFAWYLNHEEGTKYQIELINADLIELRHQAIEIIKNAEKQIEEAQAQLDLVKESVVSAMKENGLTKYKDDEISITIVAPVSKQIVDTKKLEEKHPDIYNECLKTSTTKESVRLTILGEKKNELN